MADKQNSFSQFDSRTREKMGLPTGRRLKARSADKPKPKAKPKRKPAKRERVTGGAMARIKGKQIAAEEVARKARDAMKIRGG